MASREHAAGQLAVVGRGRRVALATLQEDGAVGAIRALGGRLEELAATLRGGSEKARGAALDALSPLPEGALSSPEVLLGADFEGQWILRKV